jgi:hypothetical protein
MDFLPNNSAVNPEPSFCLDLVKRCFKEIDLSLDATHHWHLPDTKVER